MSEYWDYNSWEAENNRLWKRSYEEWRAHRPVCEWCGEPILEENAYRMPDGVWICESCIEEYVDEKYRVCLGSEVTL